MGCVYRLTAPHGKAYIGVTLNLERRLRQHAHLAGKRGTFLIHKAIRKYGWDNFQKEVLFQSEERELLRAKEIEMIAHFQTHFSGGCGYNMTLGGDGMRGYHATPETRERLRLSHLGKRHSDESRAKMVLAHRGRKNTPEHNQHISAAIMGHPSYKKTGTPCKTETRERLREAMTGKAYPGRKKPPTCTDEHRQHLREGQSRRRAREQEEKENAARATQALCDTPTNP